MTNQVKLPPLPHEFHEWVEIQVWEERPNEFVVSGSYSEGGVKKFIYNDALIAKYPTREEATAVGLAISKTASAARLIHSLYPVECNFKEET